MFCVKNKEFFPPATVVCILTCNPVLDARILVWTRFFVIDMLQQVRLVVYLPSNVAPPPNPPPPPYGLLAPAETIKT
jgi:hypothetical protein